MSDKLAIRKIADIENFQGQYITLFKEVFNAETSEGFFNWKFNKTKNFLLAGIENNNVVSFYGLTPRTFIYKDTIFTGVQPCDVMVSASYRGALGSSIFQKMLNGYKKYLESNDTEYVFLFGFPHQRHMKLGERLSGYGLGDHLQWLEWPKNIKTRYNLDCYKEVINEKVINDIHILWPNMRESMREHSLGLRDANYMKYRYFNHPLFTYEAIRVEENNVVIGFVIIKKNNKQQTLMDVVAHKNNIGKVCDSVANHLYESEDLNKVRIAISSQFSYLITSENKSIILGDKTPIAIGNLVDKYWDNTKHIYQRLHKNVFFTLGDQESN